MVYDHSTAAPLMAAINEKWAAYATMTTFYANELDRSCVKPWFDVAPGTASVTDLTAAIKALSDYIDTLAPQ